MLNWVGIFSRQQTEQMELGRTSASADQEYVQVINELTLETLDVDEKLEEDLDATKTDLDEIVAYREEFLDGIVSR